jgi:uncharacterized protein (DUF1800 family)
MSQLVMRRMRGFAWLVCMAIVAWLCICCGGNGSGSGGSPAPQISVSISGATQTRLGATTQFTANVSGTSNAAVTWEVNGTAAGSAATGTISASGLYTAPTTMPSSPNVTISAVSQASAMATGSVTEGLENPLPVVSAATAAQVGSSLSYAFDVTGLGFVPSSSIQINGTGAATTFVSGTELQATATIPSGMTAVSVDVTTPDPGASTSAAMNVQLNYVAATATAAARLLDQSSFGPTTATIAHVQAVGINGYLTEQFALTPTTIANISPTTPPAFCTTNSLYPCAETEWWTAAINAPDQLRQRVAFALAEMFVVSTESVNAQTIPQFQNVLVNDAFTNFSTIMKDVTLSPAMGAYLNMLNSAAPPTGQIANENYARENMQLFTIGLNLLNSDSTLQLDGSGNPIPAYTQAQVQAFARAYTGWTYATSSGGSPTKFPNGTSNYTMPMAAVQSAHDTTSKTLLNGTVLSAGQTAQQDLDGALSNLFNHPNAGPFVCQQLIQHLVTSTPSPAYVARVAAIFANNGAGIRGDMKAVITAILTDQEARSGDTNVSFDGGHLREPILFVTAMVRGLGFTNTDPNSSYQGLTSATSKLSEEPYRANSVFNFFPPDYVIPGTSLNAPEFGIENTASVTLRLSLADSIVNNKLSGFNVDLSNTSTLGVLAANPANLVDALSNLFMHSQMPTAMRSAIISAITPLTSNAQRVRVAVFLVVTSSQYKVIH